ncbi:MAG: DUF1737 domain-containing protein [bacterium]|nr:DUF1737 domain-containing protein [bacterium]
MDYMIATKSDLVSLIDRVKYLIEEGWRPQGGISESITQIENAREGGWTSCSWYLQAMVKND